MLSPKIIALEEGWNNEIKAKAIDVLEDMLNTGLDKNKPRLFDPKEYVQTYTTCYNMCTQRSPYNWSEQLYQRHGETICDYLSKTVLPALKQKSGNALLTELTVRWSNHKIMNKWMRLFFMYLDRYYVKHHSLPTLDVAGLKHFKTLVYNEVKKDVVNAMIALIDAERDQALIDRALVKNTVELLEAMGMGSLDAYVTDFEDQLLASTKEYYARKSQEWVESDDAPAYLAKAEVALEAEAARVAHYLNGASEPKLLRVCEHEILELRETVLLEKEGSGCRALLANDRKADLARMYRLFGRVPNTPTHGLPPMAALVRAHIEQMGNDIIDRREARLSEGAKDSNQDPAFVKELLALHDKYLAVVSEQFGGNALFQKALKEAFVEFANRDVGKHTNAELMSSFCDRILKSGGEKLGDEDVEAFLEKTVQLFSYLTDKDLFAEIYRNQLAKRLLNQRSASDDAERLMIGKLKLRCGSQFTGKMEGMLNDLAIGHDHQADFESYVKADSSRSTGKLDFSVQVLTTGYWPTFASIDAHLPPEIVQCTKVFKDYYDEKNSKRRVTWMWSLGNASVKAFFGKKAYDLQVATLQAIVLLTFNPVDGSSQTLTYAQVAERVNLPDEHLKRVLHSLACGKYKVLAKTPMSSRVALTDSFAVNTKFSCPMRKIRVPMASLDESHNPKRVEEDRTVAIEAAVVRIMKARKALSHQSLLAEVLSQLAFFRPNPKVIKRRIEALIDREYLERDPEVANAYRYLA
jgi:cullin 1